MERKPDKIGIVNELKPLEFNELEYLQKLVAIRSLENFVCYEKSKKLRHFLYMVAMSTLLNDTLDFEELNFYIKKIATELTNLTAAQDNIKYRF